MNRFIDFLTVFAVLLIPIVCLGFVLVDLIARNPTESLVVFAALVTLAASQLINHDRRL